MSIQICPIYNLVLMIIDSIASWSGCTETGEHAVLVPCLLGRDPSLCRCLRLRCALRHIGDLITAVSSSKHVRNRTAVLPPSSIAEGGWA